MCYGDPVRLLAQLLTDAKPRPDVPSHSLDDEFAHFCMVHGLSVERSGEQAVQWARFLYFYDRVSVPTSPDRTAP